MLLLRWCSLFCWIGLADCIILLWQQWFAFATPRKASGSVLDRCLIITLDVLVEEPFPTGQIKMNNAWSLLFGLTYRKYGVFISL